MLMSACTCVVDNTLRVEQTDAAADAARRDPTGTADVRRRFRGEMERRFRALRSATAAAIAEQNALGVGRVSVGSIMASALSRASSERVLVFQKWFDEALKQVVLGNDGAWMLPHVRLAYGRALRRAERITGKGTQMDDAKVRALHSVAFVELQGVVEAVSQQAVREVGAGMLQNKSQAAVVRAVSDRIEKIGVQRARALVNFSVVQAFTEGTLDAFEESGVKRVGVVAERLVPRPKVRVGDARRGGGRREPREELVEILTAGDDEVCEECEDLAKGTYTIGEARGLIPAHPNCRCAVVPVADLRFAHDPDDDD